MLKAEKLEECYSVKIKGYRSSLRKVLSRPRQKGSILIGLIVTMVVMASLGAGMVYLTTTSTFQELFANNHARAYYVAESGGRYATAVIRDAYATDKTKLSAINANQKFNTSNGSFQITNWLLVSTNPDKITFSSIGTVNSGFLQAKRQLNYSIQPSNQGGSSPGTNPNQPLAVNDFIKTGSTATGQFGTVSLTNSGSALNVTHTTSETGNQPSTEAFVSPPGGNPNVFYQAWNSTKGFLSYDAQVKIAMGDWNGTAWTNRPSTYASGLLFRAKNPGNQESFYGLSFVRTKCGQGNNSDGIADTMVPNDCNGGYENKAMVMLWTRNNNQNNGDDNWLAYQLLDETTEYSDYVVDGLNGAISPWSTILIRVVEAASMKVSSAVANSISLNSFITNSAGKNAKVIRKINDSNGDVVLLLNNLDDGFISYGSSWGFRAKDVYIWAFYGQNSTDHGSNCTPLKSGATTDEIRLANPRDPSTSATYTGYDLNWLPTDIKDWTNGTTGTGGCGGTDTTNYDHFTLVQWSATLNTASAGDPNIHLMGTGKELNGIIRTSKWVTGTYYPPAYTSSTFPPEFGVNALGSNATQTYYDNIALYLLGLSGGGGADGSGSVIVSP